MAGVCTGPGPCDTTPFGTGDNWVNKVGGLPDYIRAIAKALRRSGHSESSAIATAIATVKRWAAGGDNVTPETRARAAKAVAEWESKKAASHSLTASPTVPVDLAMTVMATNDMPTVTVPAGMKAPKNETLLPDEAAIRRAIASLSKLPVPLRAQLAKRIKKRARELGVPVNLTAAPATTIDLANGGGLVYHWKHGWIPLDHVAALSKAHGSHTGAAHVMRKHGITAPAEHHAARLSVRQASYRGEAGHLVTGRDAHGRRVQVFAGDRAQADNAVANIRAGRPAFGDHPQPTEATQPTLPPLGRGIHVEHTGDGTLVHGTSRGDGSAEILKGHGFRWSSRLGAWYLPRGQHESTRRMKADAAHRDLVAGGHAAAITKDAGSTTSAAEREAQQRARAAGRAEHMDARAAKAAQESEARRAASDRITEHIPMGQPILVGHHSEGRHRRDIARAHSNMEKSWEADQQAKEAKASADRARAAVAGDSPLLRQRRIDRNAAEIRKIDNSLAQHEIAVAKPEAAARFGIHPSSDAHLEQLRAERARLADQVAHDTAQIEASGHKAISAANLQPGDIIHYRGRAHIVKKVNKTTVNVPTPYSWDDKVPINQITKHVRTESTAAIEKIIEDPNASPAMKTAAREILAARAKKAAKKTASLTAAPAATVDLTFTEQLHPRGAKGTAQGGKFVAKGSSDSGGSPAANTRDFQRRTGLKQSGRYDAATAAKVNALLSPKTGGGHGKGGHGKRKGGTASGGSSATQTAAQRRTNAARTAVAVNKLTPAQRELFRASHPTPPPGYRWNAAGMLVAVATNPQARRVRAILAKP